MRRKGVGEVWQVTPDLPRPLDAYREAKADLALARGELARFAEHLLKAAAERDAARADAARLAAALALVRGNLDMRWSASKTIRRMADDALARHEGEKHD